MTALSTADREAARAVDRACELANIGAGHAAGALASLIGRPCEMSVPVARMLEPGHFGEPFASELGADERSFAGAHFEVSGGPGGALAVFFPPASAEQLFAVLLGKHAGVEDQREAALREVGNILASHALSAIGDTLRTVVLPSVPEPALRAAPAAFSRMLAARGDAAPLLRIEVELHERGGALRGLLVYAPEALTGGAPAG